ncbi:MAG: aminotransferase class IV [Firmicutes bacterium]|nr:aminotransferase class IV [Bacillota bacterium]
MQVYLNGKFVPESQAMVSIDDRGFLFADGVYEVIHVYRQKLFEWDLHLARLGRSLAAIQLPAVDGSELSRVAQQLIGELGPEQSEASLYIEVTRGTHRRSHGFPPPGSTPPTVLMWVRPVNPIPEETVDHGISMITVPDDRWAQVWIKTIGLLPNVLAKEKAHQKGAFDAIFVRDGMVTEATSANIFMAKDGVLYTAPATNYILPGITRHVVLELAQARNITVNLTPFSVDQLVMADEAFLTGTLTEVLPIASIDGYPLKSPSGPLARQLLQDLHERAGLQP